MKLIAIMLLTITSAFAAVTPDTEAKDIRNALSDSKKCWVSSWGSTETVYWSVGIKQKMVADIDKYERVGDSADAINAACYD